MKLCFVYRQIPSRLSSTRLSTTMTAKTSRTSKTGVSSSKQKITSPSELKKTKDVKDGTEKDETELNGAEKNDSDDMKVLCKIYIH